MHSFGLGKRAPLSPAELKQRQDAARSAGAARHRAETSPSVQQGSSGAPSRQAVGLFRQGQSSNRQGGRSVWDTRTPEAPIGAMNVKVRFHFPKAYRGGIDRPKVKGRALAQSLARHKSDAAHQDAVITNPETLLEAHRHPQMRAIVEHAISVIRDHQAPTIERATSRGLIPEGTPPSVIVRAYKHSALKALHKAGLIDYDSRNMSEEAKAMLRPVHRFMYYAHRRVFDHLNQGPTKGKWGPFREEFGELFRSKKHGQFTGAERMRMRPGGDDFYKIIPDDSWGDVLRKAGEIALAQAAIRAATTGKPVPEPPGGVPKIMGARLKHKAQHAEIHFGSPFMNVPRIGGSTEPVPESGLYRMIPVRDLQKLTVSVSSTEDEDDDLLKGGFDLGGFNVDPNRQLNRAMRPRVRRRIPRLRLNTQRHLRHALSGGVTRQEHWQLGASYGGFGKMAKADEDEFDEEDHPRGDDGKFTSAHKAGLAIAGSAALGTGVNAAATEALTASRFARRIPRLKASGKVGLVAAGANALFMIPGALSIVDAAELTHGHKEKTFIAHNWKDWLTEGPAIATAIGAAMFLHSGYVLGRAGLMSAHVAPLAAKAVAGKLVPSYGVKLALGRKAALRAFRARAKDTPGAIVWRGAPKADPHPQARDYNAVYAARHKSITNEYGAGGNPGAVTAYRLSPDAKLLDTNVILPEHRGAPALHANAMTTLFSRAPGIGAKPMTPEVSALLDKLLAPKAIGPSIMSIKEKPGALLQLHWSPTKEQVQILKDAGYDGTIGPRRNIALHDASKLTPLYSQNRYSRVASLIPPAKLAKRLLTEADVRAAAARTRVPTKAQAEAGNYPMGHLSVGGLNISIETPKGRIRRGVGPTGRKWAVTMPAHYGYVKGTEGADGDHHDVYLGPHAHEAHHHPVHVVDQHDALTGEFDEHKALLGFADRRDAIRTYDAAFSDGRGPQRRKAVHTMSFEDFRKWVGSEDAQKPLHARLAKSHDDVSSLRMARLGKAWRGKAGQGLVRQGWAGHGLAWHGMAGLGTARQGKGDRPLIKGGPDLHKSLGLGIAGAAAGAAGARWIARGLAARKARAHASQLFHTARDSIRAHLRHIETGTAPPSVKIAAHEAARAATHRAAKDAIAQRKIGLSNRRPSKLAIGAGAAIGGAAGLQHNSERYKLPADYNTRPPDDDDQ